MQSSRARIGVLLVAVAAIIVLFVVLSSDDDGNSTTTSSTVTSTAAAVTKIKIADGKPVGGIQEITVNKGDSVNLIVSSDDTTSEVHVHGYDIMGDMAPGEPANIEFVADADGIYEIELEETATQIAELQVNP